MHPIDWAVLTTTIVSIVLYGILKTRGKQTLKSYLLGSNELKWWTIGLSIMATQASAVTFLSTTGQGFDDGMRFAQFYFGLPIAMVLLSIFFLPIYYRLNVYTAYEYLETRFDLRTRTFTASLFLLLRAMSGGLTLAAPGIVLASILGWSWFSTNALVGAFVLCYTVLGGGKAVSVTQQQQMVIILIGMLFAFGLMIYKLPNDVHFSDAMAISGRLNKLNIVDFSFDWHNKYTFWSGMIGGVFLFMSYFGTDQSQVQRYLSGKSLAESKLGLLFNGMIKVPMQVLVLMVGVMMFVFYQFNAAPLHFNAKILNKLKANSEYSVSFDSIQNNYNLNFEKKRNAVTNLVSAIRRNDSEQQTILTTDIKTLQNSERNLRKGVKDLMLQADAKADVRDRDYTFIYFIMNELPRGLVGFLIAVIFSAAMSSSASEINALSTTSMIDIYRRLIRQSETDAHYTFVSKLLTIMWGFIVLGFATAVTFFSNLIEAVNIIGSLFYGTILGIFLAGFFFKRIHSRAIFYGALIGETCIIATWLNYGLHDSNFPFLWLNPLGCILTILFASILQNFLKVKVV